MPHSLFRPLLALSLWILLGGCATVTDAPPAAPEITLTKALHFVMADGSDLIVSPGTYAVQPGNGPRLELVSSFGIVADNRTLEAVSTHVGQTFAAPVALYVPWGEDEHHIIFVQPNGQALDAVGTGDSARSHHLKPNPLPTDALKSALIEYHARPVPKK